MISSSSAQSRFLTASLFLVMSISLSHLHSCRLSHKKQKKEKSHEQNNDLKRDLQLAACENFSSVKNFQHVMNSTQCLFAKRATIWGSYDYDKSLSIEANVLKSLPLLLDFIKLSEKGAKLDGFVIEVREPNYGKCVDSLAVLVRRVLRTISRNDPSGLSCLDMKSIKSSRWYFSLCCAPIFITTFAPCYSHRSSRYSFHHTNKGIEDSSFILFQPEISFLRHDLDFDTPHTNWQCPVTVRDRVRINFKSKGREYFIPPTLKIPIAENIVIDDYICEDQKLLTSARTIQFWDDNLYPDIYST